MNDKYFLLLVCNSINFDAIRNIVQHLAKFIIIKNNINKCPRATPSMYVLSW